MGISGKFRPVAAAAAFFFCSLCEAGGGESGDTEWIVKVNGVPIPKAILDRRLPLALAQIKSIDPSFDPQRDKERVARAEKGLIEEIIKVEVLRQYARERKLAPPAAVLDEFMKFADADSRERRGKPLEKFLKDNGESLEDFRSFHAARLAVENEIRSSITIEEEKRFFEERKDFLPLRRAAHILIGFKESRKPSHKERSREEAKKKAEAIVEKLRKGADLAEIARSESDCPSRENGGDLGFFPRKGHGSPAPEISIATYMLAAPGDTTGVIESDYGFHIIKLLEVRGFEQVEPMVKDMLVYEKLQDKVEELLKTARIERQVKQ